MPFHVFIEKALEPTPEARARLAGAIAARYKLPEAQVAKYLQAGRFRVKSSVDEATARKFAAELQTLGAVVTIDDAQTGARLALSAPAPTAAPGHRAAATPGAASPAVSPSGQKFESGLAAAFSAGASEAPANLGALDNLTGVSLSSLDGSHEELAGSAGLSAAEPVLHNTRAFEAPDGHEGAPLDLVDDPRTRASALQAAGTPRPMAAVPPLDLEHDEPLEPRTPAARPPVPAAPSTPAQLASAAAPPGRPAAAPARPVSARPAAARAPEVEGGPLAPYFAARPRSRLLAGAALALALGFLPATIYASSAEDAQYGKIRRALSETQESATTQSRWQALDAPDGARTVAAADAERARGRIRRNAGAIWVLAAGAVALLWFKKLA